MSLKEPDAPNQELRALEGAVAGAQTASLDKLAEVVRTADRGVALAATGLIMNALAAGEALLVAKEKIPHGGWLKWLKAECDLSEDRAERYMRLARGRAVLEANSARMRNLSLAGALQLLPKTARSSSSSRSSTKKTKSTSLDALGWWAGAGIEARQHFIDGVGRSGLCAAVPASWNLEGRMLRAVSNEKLLAELERRLPTDLWKKHSAAMKAIARGLSSIEQHAGPILDLKATSVTESEATH
jgi:hypothetical protein